MVESSFPCFQDSCCKGFGGDTVAGGTVGSGGLVIAESGSVVSGLALASGGYLLVLSGATATSLASSGGMAVSTGVLVDDTAAGNIVYAASALDLGATGSSSEAYVLAGGTLIFPSERSGWVHAWAVEARGGSPVIAVQWHPELEQRPDGVFDALVAAVRQAAAVPVTESAGLR